MRGKSALSPAKELGSDEMMQVDMSKGKKSPEFYVIWNAEKPYEEYVIVFPKDYIEEYTYRDYIKLNHTPLKNVKIG